MATKDPLILAKLHFFMAVSQSVTPFDKVSNGWTRASILHQWLGWVTEVSRILRWICVTKMSIFIQIGLLLVYLGQYVTTKYFYIIHFMTLRVTNLQEIQIAQVKCIVKIMLMCPEDIYFLSFIHIFMFFLFCSNYWDDSLSENVWLMSHLSFWYG